MNTLKVVASEGAAALYTGSLANSTVQALHGYLTLEDLGNYTVVEREAISTQIGHFQILATPSPTSGPQTLAFVNAMEEYNRRYGSHGIDVKFLSNVTMVSSKRVKKPKEGDKQEEKRREVCRRLLSGLERDLLKKSHI